MCGQYTEIYFPERHVRYIALNDGVDTLNQTSSMDITPFKHRLCDAHQSGDAAGNGNLTILGTLGTQSYHQSSNALGNIGTDTAGAKDAVITQVGHLADGLAPVVLSAHFQT